MTGWATKSLKWDHVHVCIKYMVVFDSSASRLVVFLSKFAIILLFSLSFLAIRQVQQSHLDVCFLFCWSCIDAEEEALEPPMTIAWCSTPTPPTHIYFSWKYLSVANACLPSIVSIRSILCMCRVSKLPQGIPRTRGRRWKFHKFGWFLGAVYAYYLDG